MIVLLLVLILCVLLFGASRVLDVGREVLAIVAITVLVLLAITYGPSLLAWFAEYAYFGVLFFLLAVALLFALYSKDSRPRATRSSQQTIQDQGQPKADKLAPSQPAYGLDEPIDEDALLPVFKDTKGD